MQEEQKAQPLVRLISSSQGQSLSLKGTMGFFPENAAERLDGL
jgi:hypothetical protein